MTARCDECKFWDHESVAKWQETWGLCDRYGQSPPPRFLIHPNSWEADSKDVLFLTAPDFFCVEFAPKVEEGEASE